MLILVGALVQHVAVALPPSCGVCQLIESNNMIMLTSYVGFVYRKRNYKLNMFV